MNPDLKKKMFKFLQKSNLFLVLTLTVVLLYFIMFTFFFKQIKIMNFFRLVETDSFFSYQQNYIFISIVLVLIIIILLNKKVLFFKKYSLFLLLLFLPITFILIFTSSSLVFFLTYEFLLLLTAVIVYFNSPNIRAKKITLHFLFWTQLSSLILWIAILLIYFKTHSFNFGNHHVLNLNKNFFFVIKLLILISFSIKLPVWPFSYWLIKTHVEANTSFSIFLSGVLIKTALIGLIKFNIFFVNNINFIILFFIISSLTITSLELFSQVDLKKLIAYTTIQEMSLFLLFINFIGFNNKNLLFYFIILHTITSLILFYINDLIYIRFRTRKTKLFLGCAINTPKLNCVLIVVWLFFTSLPFTLKFIIELVLLLKIITLPLYFVVIIIIMLQFFTIIFFSSNFITYSFGNGKKTSFDLLYSEFLIISLSLSLLFFLVI